MVIGAPEVGTERRWMALSGRDDTSEGREELVSHPTSPKDRQRGNCDY